MFSNESLSELLGLIYDCVQAPATWSAVLERFSDELDAKAASVHLFHTVQGRASLFVEYGTDPKWTALLLQKYAEMSPIRAGVLCADVDEPIGAFDFIDEDEFVGSRFYQEWCKPQGYHDMLGAIIAKRPSEVGAISATRGLDKGRFGSAERRFVALVAPHVRRAVTISELLEQRAIERDGLLAMIDQLAASVLVLDRNCTLNRANAAGEALCRDGDVLAVTNGRVTLKDGTAQQALEAALQSQDMSPRLFPVTSRSGKSFIAGLLVCNARTGTRALIVNRLEPDQPALGRHLAALFELTPREVTVLTPLLQGHTIDETAAQLGISEATARTHLKRLLAKTRTNRQVDLVQAVMQALPPVRVHPEADKK